MKTLLACLLLCAASGLTAQTIDITSMESDIQLKWGVQAYHRGFYADALVSIQKALSIKPSNSSAQIWQGRVYWKSGFESEALRTWERLDASGGATPLVRSWIQDLRQRFGTARDVPRDPAFVKSAELSGTAGHPFKRPSSVRARPDGSFYVAAFGSNEVLHYDANFRLLDFMKGGLEGFNRPFDAIDMPDGTILVSEYGADKVSRCTDKGEKIKSFGGKGSGPGQLLGPQYLALDDSGFVYVTDWGNARVNKYDPDGTFVLSITGLQGPSGIVVNEGRVFVSEKTAKRISIFDTNGNFLSFVGEGTFSAPEGLAFTRGGRLLVADAPGIWEGNLETEQWVMKADTTSLSSRIVQQVETANGDILGAVFDESKVVFLSDPLSLYSGFSVRVDRVNSQAFPAVFVDVTVQDRFGKPIVGLDRDNFVITESRRPVGAASMVSADSGAADVMMVVETSPALFAQRKTAEQAAGDLYAAVGSGRIKAISAGETAQKKTDYGEARLRFLSSAFSGTPSDRWRLDLALRLAGDELVSTSSRARRAVVFLTSGGVGQRPYLTYSLMNLVAYMRNNSIAFYPVSLGSMVDDDLAFLASETGGKSYGVFTPGGMADVMREIRSRVSPIYTLTYRSPSDSDFGNAYIPIEVEATVQKMSGRDECGY